MGLDVYLYYSKDLKKKNEIEKTYNEESSKIHKSYCNKKDILNKKLEELALKLGTDKYGTPVEYQKEINENSKKYPDHLFKIGYFRSSYNPGGINHILEQATGNTLYDIFPESNGDKSEITPDWNAAKENVVAIREQFETFNKQNGNIRAEFFGLNSISPQGEMSERSAVQAFLNEKKKHEASKSDYDAYSNIVGHFFMKESAKVFAIMPSSQFGRPGVWIIFEESEDKNFYSQALEIVEETIDYVLSQKDPRNYYMYWSG